MNDKMELVEVNDEASNFKAAFKALEERLVGQMIPNGLEEAFSGLVKFDNETKKQRTILVRKVADCLFDAGITKITVVNTFYEILCLFDAGITKVTVVNPLYETLYLWFIKYGNFDASMITHEENKSRFKTIYDLETALPELLATKVEKYRKPRRLQYTRPGK